MSIEIQKPELERRVDGRFPKLLEKLRMRATEWTF
jgi:hypothetical protein